MASHDKPENVVPSLSLTSSDGETRSVAAQMAAQKQLEREILTPPEATGEVEHVPAPLTSRTRFRDTDSAGRYGVSFEEIETSSSDESRSEISGTSSYITDSDDDLLDPAEEAHRLHQAAARRMSTRSSRASLPAPPIAELVVLGSSRVGKSAMVASFIDNEEFDFTEYEPTVEDDHYKVIVVDCEAALLHIIDTAGIEHQEYDAQVDNLVRTAHAFLVCCSADVPGSFEAAEALVERIRHLRHDLVGSQLPPIMIVETKADLAHPQQFGVSAPKNGKQKRRSTNADLDEPIGVPPPTRTVKTFEKHAEKLAARNNLHFTRCSSTYHEHITEAFQDAVRLARGVHPRSETKRKGTLTKLKDRAVNLFHLDSRANLSIEEKEMILWEKELQRRKRLRVVADTQRKFLRPAYDPVLLGSDTPPSQRFMAQKGARKIIIAASLGDLPKDVLASLRRTKISEAQLSEHLNTVMNIMSFADKCRPKRRFYSRWRYDRETAPGFDQKSEYNVHKIRMLVTDDHRLFEDVSLSTANELYRPVGHLGSGGFGDVLLAEVLEKGLDHTGAVAIKIQSHRTEKEMALNRHEVSVLQYLNHPNLCRMHRALHVGDEVWIVMEHLTGGTVKHASTSVEGLEEPVIAYIANEMLKGIEYLHRKRLVHRDLKSANIMITYSGDVKIIDFGLLCDVSMGPTRQMVGSPFWMAPEMVRGERHTYPVDIWSFAICLLELANRIPPNRANVKRALFLSAHGSAGDIDFLEPHKWSSLFRDFVHICLERDQRNRPTAVDLLKHPWLNQRATREEVVSVVDRVFQRDRLMVAAQHAAP